MTSTINFYFGAYMELAFAVAALIIGAIALIISCVGLAIIVGLKNSTHQVTFKTLEELKGEKLEPEADPFKTYMEEVDMTKNPNKRLTKIEGAEGGKVLNMKEDFADLDDPENISHDWN
jgi:hypothetical protein